MADQIIIDCETGEAAIVPFVPTPPTEAEIAAQWSKVRSDRNQRLAECDWTQLADSPLTNVQAADWASYRQELRDITTQADPFNIEWPSKP